MGHEERGAQCLQYEVCNKIKIRATDCLFPIFGFFCSDKKSHGNQVGLSLGSKNFSAQTEGESKESGCQTSQTQTSIECEESPGATATATDPVAKSLKVSKITKTSFLKTDMLFSCNIQVQVRTKTPSGIQIETMDIDKLFENV